MNRAVKNIIKQLTDKPNVLFLMDSLGALLTAFSLFVILRNFNEYIGMPKTILSYLALIAICFCIYSAACFFFVKKHWALFIRGVSISNLLYCTLTIGLVIVNSPFITVMGLSYFLAEIAIICSLVYIELKVASAIKQNRLENNR
jgi:hypothetical protein